MLSVTIREVTLFLEKGDLDKAVADFTEAIRLIGIAAPQAAAIEYCNRGIAYRRKGDLNRAILNHTQAIRLNPSDDGAFFNRALDYARKGDVNIAIEDNSAAIRINPHNSKAFRNRGMARAKNANGRPQLRT